MTEDSQSSFEKIVFKRKKIKSKRRSLELSDNEDEQKAKEDDISAKLSETKAFQRLRSRPKGVSVVGLALGRKIAAEEEDLNVVDPFKTKSGGMVNMKTLKSGKVKKVDDAYETGIGTQFSAETNKRDEDEEMMKYIEEQLSKKKGVLKSKVEEKNENHDEESKYCSPEEAALLAVPAHLRVSSTQRSEEMLSHQMLSGIPEVDLGIDAKIRNIEATEEAKLKLLRSKLNKKEGPSQFVPTNITVNFMQQNKINLEDTEPLRKKEEREMECVNGSEGEGSGKRKQGEKATDDYHYERFKKQFRRF